MMRLARFGTSVAGLVLEDLLKEHNVTKSRQVNSMIVDLHEGLNFLYDAPNKRVYQGMWNLWYEEFKRRANALRLPDIVKDHLLATIVGLCRQKRREYMINRGGLCQKKERPVANRKVPKDEG